ncbi:alpha/beta fold hydrolase [Alkalihalobacillus sp. CinArs1]|uniref:alpha/beta fold hydrolase n=1 Tax=Alkalihalobacillus sp. CinArs1 TaxID=2995314 RepID=UPI0022DE815F|nr:alpha/beta hydrolase [Alkalihalobacillus sp. CinArs1]
METSLTTTSHGIKEYYYRRGTGKTIVLLTGMGGSLYEWNELMDSDFSFLAYNRAGYGRSEPVLNHTLATPHEELYSLLEALSIDEAVMLAGFSYGGLIAQGFAMHYPEKVAGVLLIDSTSINMHRLDEVKSSDETNTDEYWLKMCSRLSALTPTELELEQPPELHPKQKEWNNTIQQALYDHDLNPSLYQTVGKELSLWKEYAASLHNRSFPQVPLVIIARDKKHSIREQIDAGTVKDEAEEMETVWSELIQEQRLLASNSTYRVAKGSGHHVPLNRPDLILHSLKELLNR